MATLYVENIPEDVYTALRKRARENRSSIAAEVIALLRHNVPTSEELKQRRQFFERMAELRSRQPESSGPFPSAEDIVREDRER
jgi:plasmid stability protein